MVVGWGGNVVVWGDNTYTDKHHNHASIKHIPIPFPPAPPPPPPAPPFPPPPLLHNSAGRNGSASGTALTNEIKGGGPGPGRCFSLALICVAAADSVSRRLICRPVDSCVYCSLSSMDAQSHTSTCCRARMASASTPSMQPVRTVPQCRGTAACTMPRRLTIEDEDDASGENGGGGCSSLYTA